MSLEGTINNGQIELDTPIELPNGTRVLIEPVVQETKAAPESPRVRADGTPIPDTRPDGTPLTTLNKFLLSISGTVQGWPSDMSVNHDHYIHGARKRKT